MERVNEEQNKFKLVVSVDTISQETPSSPCCHIHQKNKTTLFECMQFCMESRLCMFECIYVSKMYASTYVLSWYVFIEVITTFNVCITITKQTILLASAYCQNIMTARDTRRVSWGLLQACLRVREEEGHPRDTQGGLFSRWASNGYTS